MVHKRASSATLEIMSQLLFTINWLVYNPYFWHWLNWSLCKIWSTVNMTIYSGCPARAVLLTEAGSSVTLGARGFGKWSPHWKCRICWVKSLVSWMLGYSGFLCNYKMQSKEWTELINVEIICFYIDRANIMQYAGHVPVSYVSNNTRIHI